jgi:hypothetical protein
MPDMGWTSLAIWWKRERKINERQKRGVGLIEERRGAKVSGGSPLR